MPYPVEGIDLAVKADMARQLMEAGASIYELNTVRKHMSSVKGGQLAKAAKPAKLVSLILSDVVGDRLDVIASGPTAPDNSTFREAVEVLQRYRLWGRLHTSIKRRFNDGLSGKIPETPKTGDPCFEDTSNVILGNNATLCQVALQKFRREGVSARIVSTTLQGEAKKAGVSIALMLERDFRVGRKRLFGFVFGGETTVQVRGKGVGGRNQELVLSALTKLSGLGGSAIASIGSDGIDGPTKAAGAIADEFSLSRAGKMGVNPMKALRQNDSYHFFEKLGDAIITGPTGTNLGDVTVAISI